MRVVMLVPRRADGGRRDELWAFVRDWWTRRLGWPIFEGHHDDGPFNRSAAINRAAKKAGGWDAAVIADSDTFASETQTQAAVDAAVATGKIVFAYDRYCYLSRKGSDRVMAGFDGSWEPFIEWSHRNACSGLVAVSRSLWDTVGGFDEGFVGWGFEDIGFSLACQTLAGDHLRVHGDVWHLWHPPSETNNTALPTYKANEERQNGYVAARNNREKMRALLDGIKDRPLSAKFDVEVTAGNGIASTFPVTGLRFDPHPGTLNVTSSADADFFGEPDGVVDPWYRGPQPFRYGTFNGVPVAVLGAAERIKVGWQLELIAPVHLRSTFDLADGSVGSLTIGDR